MSLTWILERRDRKYGRGAIYSSDALGAGLYVFAFVFYPNLLIVSTKPVNAGLYGESAYTGVGRFLPIQGKRFQDAGNASYYERPSGGHENPGNKKKAPETARMAAKLEPTVRNHWRLRGLED